LPKSWISAILYAYTIIVVMETLEKTLQVTHDWAVDRLNILCDMETDDVLKSIEDAHAIQSEFAEWLDPNLEDHEIYSLEYLKDDN